jgi:iron(III) transport system ATP-binding protein
MPEGDCVTAGVVPAARVRGISKLYGGVLAVDDVSFDVAPGELLTLLGPSGCGKTSTMRAIAGLERINGGEILLNERVVSSVLRRVHLAPEKRDVGMVFQSYAIWPHMTVFENVAYPLRCRKVERDELQRRVRDGLRLVEMQDYEARRATELSGGQQQRVALARAIVMQPAVLLLDEPLCNLDAKLRGQMRLHIKQLQQRTGLTMIYVTHDQVEAMALSDRIIVMNGGVIEQVGTPEEIYERPHSEFVADFVGATNFIWGNVIAVEAGGELVRVAAGGEILVGALEGARPAVGARVVMVLRPETISVADGEAGESGAATRGEGPMNRIAGVVMTTTYCGDHREMTVAAKDFTLRVTAPSTVMAPPGTAVRLAFSCSNLRLLPQHG